MANPFYEAQADAATDPSIDAPPEMGPPPPPGEQAAPEAGPQGPPPAQAAPTLQTPSADSIAAIRDSILAQFPEIQEEPVAAGMNGVQKLAMFGMFLANPKGALDLLRAKRERAFNRAKLKAELQIKATGIAGEILKAQNNAERAMLEMRLATNRDFRAQRESEYRMHLDAQRAELERMRFEEQRAHNDDMRDARNRELDARIAEIERRRALDTAREERMRRLEGTVADVGQPGPSGVPSMIPPTTNPLTGETDQSLSPEAAAAAPPVPPAPTQGMRRTVTIGPNGPSVSYSQAPPVDPMVAFNRWVESRFAGRIPAHLRENPELLYQMFQREQQVINSIADGTFGAQNVPFGGGYPDLFQSPDEPLADPDAEGY